MLLATAVVPGTTAEAAHPRTDSADRLIFWTDCEEVVKLTDADLDAWKGRGVDGFVCMVGHMRGMGGTQDFSGDPRADLSGPAYELHRGLRDSNIAARAAARRMKMYLGIYLVNHWNQATPLRDWFDDAGWSELVAAKVNDVAGAAKQLGFAGLAFDQELYTQAGRVESASWDWDYPGNRRPESQVRAMASQRGRELMSTILGAFPGVELMAYDVGLPNTWEEVVQEVVNGKKAAFDDRLDIDFWDGLSSVEGYRAIRLIDATFYKMPHLGTWDTALRYHYNRLYSYLSRRLSNWEYASSRVFVSPFSWIDAGPCSCPYDDARPAAYVQEQLLAFGKWGMGGEFVNYAYAGLSTFDYSPYVNAMQAASIPTAVDTEPPRLAAPGAGKTGRGRKITGTARDNLAIRAVRWSDDRGRSGVAELNWKLNWTGPRSEEVSETRWSFPASALAPGARRVRITAEDIKGHTSEPIRIRIGNGRSR